MQWFQGFQDDVAEVLPPNILDHSPIRVSRLDVQTRRKYLFKFINYVIKKEGYHSIVKDSW